VVGQVSADLKPERRVKPAYVREHLRLHEKALHQVRAFVRRRDCLPLEKVGVLFFEVQGGWLRERLLEPLARRLQFRLTERVHSFGNRTNSRTILPCSNRPAVGLGIAFGQLAIEHALREQSFLDGHSHHLLGDHFLVSWTAFTKMPVTIAVATSVPRKSKSTVS